jgi:hypothetical protein
MVKTGRNDPCPCGSERKYKKCCASAHAPEAKRDPKPQNLFGASGASALRILDSFAHEARPTSFPIMPLVEFEAERSLASRNQIYWREILYRAHFAASAGLLRLREWLHGARAAFEARNVLMAAAGLRGFLEAAADTWQGLNSVSPSLANNHSVVRAAVSGLLDDQAYLFPELESDLVHFTYARKQQIAMPVPRGFLCDFCHPAAPTVLRFGMEQLERLSGDTLAFDPSGGSLSLDQIEGAAIGLGPLGPLSVGTCVLTLATLNRLGFDQVETPWADGQVHAFPTAWHEIARKLAGSGSPTVADEAEAQRLSAKVERAYEALPPKGSKKGVK